MSRGPLDTEKQLMKCFELSLEIMRVIAPKMNNAFVKDVNDSPDGAIRLWSEALMMCSIHLAIPNIEAHRRRSETFSLEEMMEAVDSVMKGSFSMMLGLLIDYYGSLFKNMSDDEMARNFRGSSMMTDPDVKVTDGQSFESMMEELKRQSGGSNGQS